MAKGERTAPMETTDLSGFMEETESPDTVAYERVLDVLYLVAAGGLQWTTDAGDARFPASPFALRYY